MAEEKHDKDKIALILEAARKRFGHYGLAKTTMTEIADDIGLSKASLYYYFPDKENIFKSVIEKEMEGFFHQMEKIMVAPLAASVKLQHYVDERFAFSLQYLNLSKLTAQAADSLKPSFGNMHERFNEHETKIIKTILDLGLKKKEFSTLDTQTYAALFVSLLRGLRLTTLQQRDSYLLTEEDYKTLQQSQSLFTKVFIKGITRTTKK